MNLSQPLWAAVKENLESVDLSRHLQTYGPERLQKSSLPKGRFQHSIRESWGRGKGELRWMRIHTDGDTAFFEVHTVKLKTFPEPIKAVQQFRAFLLCPEDKGDLSWLDSGMHLHSSQLAHIWLLVLLTSVGSSGQEQRGMVQFTQDQGWAMWVV